jgi:NDP-sugar pyrophosphorylase family protein
MQAVLMAGGKGTRLQPFTAILPKPLVPIGDISILEMVLRQLQFYGFRKIIITVGHKAELVMAVVGDGNRFGIDIIYHNEEKPLGTIGALAYLEDLEDNFLVMNGDICTNLDFREFYNDHIKSGAMATIGAYARREKIELGVLTVEEYDQNIVGFQEKPTYDFLVSMGVNAFNKSIVSFVPKGKFFGFDDLMHKMLEKKVVVRSYLFGGLWHDIGRPDDYEKMLQDFKADPSAYLPDGA